MVNRRTHYELRKARDRAHLLEGLGVALSNVDEMIQLIKAAKTPQEAKEKLLAQDWATGMVAELLAKAGVEATQPEDLPPNRGMTPEKRYLLTEVQAQAILDLKLQRLTGLEQDKIFEEYTDILKYIHELLEILNDPAKLMDVIRQELREARDQYADARRSEIITNKQDLSNEDLISEESRVLPYRIKGMSKPNP